MSNYPQQFEECPVCYAKLKTEIGTLDEGTICEQYETCPNKCYSYEFAFGSTVVYVDVRGHHLQFGWTYLEDKKTLRAETDAIDTACEAARRAQLEDYWSLVQAGQCVECGNRGVKLQSWKGRLICVQKCLPQAEHYNKLIDNESHL